jgi:very-short-patch-repair endonuclease
VLTRGDLLGLGFSGESIKHRIEKGRLHPSMPGVYAVGRPELTREGRWMAAVLACGEGAALSHRSAAALWKIEKEGGRIEVAIRRKSGLRRPGIRVRTRQALGAEDITSRLGIPLTRPVQTLIDLATELSPQRLERAVNEADKRDLVDPETVRVALDRRVGEPGVRALRTLLDRHTFRLSDTELEVLFRPLAAAAGLPVPLTKQMVNGYEVDFHWPDLGLVVETDGLRYHRTASTQSRDALRDQTHTAAGLTPLRFSHHQVKYEPRRVRDVLSRTAANLQR